MYNSTSGLRMPSFLPRVCLVVTISTPCVNPLWHYSFLYFNFEFGKWSEIHILLLLPPLLLAVNNYSST